MSLKISRVLHAGYIFESSKTRIIFDPIFENPFSFNCFAYPNVEFDVEQIRALKFDAIFISHYHDDHFSVESLQHLDRSIPIYLYCVHEEMFAILRELGFLNVFSMRTDQTVHVSDFEITPRLALDSDVDSLFQISAHGINVLNVVDAWIDPSAMSKLMAVNWDVVLWPFQTMREIEVIAPSLAKPSELPAEWLEQLALLKPKMVVPSSCQFIHEEWSWYRTSYFPISYSRFRSEVEAVIPGVRVQKLNPGVSMEIGAEVKMIEALSWVMPIGDQDLDYEYTPEVVPMPTSEIAKHIVPLSEAQKLRVINFCKIEVRQKYSSMNFDEPWKLTLFDHSGLAIAFCFGGESAKWSTEVPIAKVYSALENGESLTSMYLRMEGMPFDDIGLDPLIASLYSGDIDSYQRAQLKTLNNSNFSI